MSAIDSTRFICLFHDANRGRSAVDALEDAGFSRDAITVQGSQNSGSTGSDPSESLQTMGIPERDLPHFRDALQKGGTLVSLEAPESRSSDIERIFHKYSADKIDEADLAPSAAAATGGDSAAAVSAENAVIPVAEESLIVGKREVDRGGVRVFRRTVEEPVNEKLNLREEHVVLDRRPVDREVSDADIAAAGQVIELTETAEVPVVTKTSRVVEEVRVGLERSDRTEVVEDTVRHTEVDVESLPATGSSRSTDRY